MTPSIRHKRLATTFNGVLHPCSDDGIAVHQYRGIKFASVPARLRRAVLVEKYPEVVDATTHGPACPQNVFPQKFEDSLSGVPQSAIDAIGRDFQFSFDEFECLNLVVNTPGDAKLGDDLPIMAYIHGGGNVFGDVGNWFNDGAELVKESVRIGKPMVVVAMNYRLGTFGWLGSKALRADNAANGDEGVGNYGLVDIHLALRWIYLNISPFGGSPARITISGESAGSWDVAYLLHSHLPAYHRRAILQSGTATGAFFSSPISLDESDQIMNRIMKVLEIENIEQLRRVSTDDLMKAFAVADQRAASNSMPTIDGVIFDKQWRDRLNFAEGDGSSYSTAVMIGDCQNEGSVAALISTVIPKPEARPSFLSFIKSISSLPKDVTQNILDIYNIASSSPLLELKANLCSLSGDICMAAPTHEMHKNLMASKAVSHAYRFIFNQANGFGGFFEGTANHALDLYHLFAPSEIFEVSSEKETDLKVQQAIREHFITFVNGSEPWQRAEDHAFVYGEGKSNEGGKIIGLYEIQEFRNVEKWKSLDRLSKEQMMEFSLRVQEFIYQL